MDKLLFIFVLLASTLSLKANDLQSQAVPTEPGMYQRDNLGNWEEVEALIFNSKTGGVIKSLVTLGVIKPDLNANVWQRSSVHSASYQDEFIVVVPEGVSTGEYRMIHLHEHKADREFRMKTGGIFHYSSGSHRDNQEFKKTKIAPRTYLVSFQRYQGAGQFGFLPPPSFIPNAYAYGRIYCFQMRN